MTSQTTSSSDVTRPFRSILAALAALPPVEVAGHVYTGAGLAALVAVNPHDPVGEAAETPQIIFEIGAVVAQARHSMETTESLYRIWREGQIHRLTNNLEAAIAVGFDCAVNPGADAKGVAKEPKLPSIAAAESYVRTTPEYAEHYAAKTEAYRAWQTVYAAQEAANARRGAVREFESNGYVPTERGMPRAVGGHARVNGSPEEAAATAEPRSPLPPPPAGVAPPPPPPTAPARMGPPPPPTARTT